MEDGEVVKFGKDEEAEAKPRSTGLLDQELMSLAN